MKRNEQNRKKVMKSGGQNLSIVLFGIFSSISQYINQNSKENRMKALLGMAKQRRKQQPNQPKPLSKLNLSKQRAPEPPSEQQEYNDNFDEEQYEPDEQEILGYADYIGIKLPEEEDLLYIAREGLMADMPPGWEEQETQDGNVYYVNSKTGQALAEHPCDEHYRQLVIKQRRKRGGGVKSGVGSLFSGPQKINLQTSKQPKKDMDPLVKLQQQKKKKKQVQQKRKQYQEKKKQTEQRYNRKKQELQSQYKKKQTKMRQKYDEQIRSEKKKKQKRMSQQQKQNEQKTKKQMQKYQREVRAKLEKKYHDRRMMEKEKIQAQMKAKRQDIRKQSQQQIKQKKKQLQQQNKQKLKILLQKQQKLIPTHSQADLFEQQLAEIKKQIIAKQLKNHEQKMEKERYAEEDHYRSKMGEIQRMFEEEVRKLEGMGGQGHRQLAFDGVFLQVQAAQKRQLQGLQYEIKMQRELKKAQLQLQLQTHKTKIQASQNQDLLRLQNSLQHTLQKIRTLKQQQQQTKLSERQKKLRQSYLSSLQELHKKYLQQEQMIILQSSSSADLHQENDMHTLSVCEQVLERLSGREENLRREVAAIRGEIGKIGEGYKPIRYKLDDQQLRMYELIRANILGSGAQTTQNKGQQ